MQSYWIKILNTNHCSFIFQTTLIDINKMFQTTSLSNIIYNAIYGSNFK